MNPAARVLHAGSVALSSLTGVPRGQELGTALRAMAVAAETISAGVTITVLGRGNIEETFEVPAVPRIGEQVRTERMAAARVADVVHDLRSGTIRVWAQ